MFDHIIEIDRGLLIYLNGLGTETFDFFWLLVTNKLLNFILYFILSVIYLKKENLKQYGLLLFCLGIMILFTDQVTNIFKYTFARLRPCHNDDILNNIRLLKSNCGGLYGYFSAHASNSFALAVFFSNLFYKRINNLPFLLLTFASLVSYSRIYIGVHYPFDVISGAIFGTFSGYMSYTVFKRYIQIKT